METPGMMQAKAADIFSGMVMEEAIKDKTIQVNKQIQDLEGKPVSQKEIDEIIKKDEDEDFDDEEEKILNNIREKRMMQLKNEFTGKQENFIKGHGQYTEITEQEFLTAVTSSKLVLCHFYH